MTVLNAARSVKDKNTLWWYISCLSLDMNPLSPAVSQELCESELVFILELQNFICLRDLRNASVPATHVSDEKKEGWECAQSRGWKWAMALRLALLHGGLEANIRTRKQGKSAASANQERRTHKNRQTPVS